MSRFAVVTLSALLLLSACEGGTPRPAPAEMETSGSLAGGGFRLWRLDLGLMGLPARAVDAQVALPLWRALDDDGRLQVAACRSDEGRLRFWLRVPVHESALKVCGEALGKISLPDGSSAPSLEPAGATPPWTRRLHLQVDRSSLTRMGLSLDGLGELIRKTQKPYQPFLASGLLNLPLPLGDGRPLFRLAPKPAKPDRPWVLRAQARDLSSLRAALQDLAASRMPQEPGQDTLPAWGARLRVELDHARLGRLELRAAHVRRQVALALGEQVRPWPDGPLLLSFSPTAPEDLSRLPIFAGDGARVPLGEVASIHLRPGPDCVLRLGPRRLVAYAFPAKTPSACRAPACRPTGSLPLAERAMLDWP